MTFRNLCGVALAAATLGAFGCASNPPAQEPSTTGATSAPQDNGSPNTMSGNTSSGSMQNGQQPTQSGDNGQGATNQDQNGAQGPSSNGAMQGQMQGANTFTNDAEIAAFTDAVNKAEIQQARLAVQRAKDPQVKAFAQEMINQHSQFATSQKHMMSTMNVTPQATAPTTALESQAQSDLSTLTSKTGSDFDKAYIDLQVQEHQAVLTKLTSELIPAAHSSQFKSELTNLQPKLQHHLERAEAIQKHLGGANP